MKLTKFSQIDTQISEKIRNRSYSPLSKQVLAILAHSADSWYWGIGLGIFWFLGSHEERILVQLLFIGIILTALFVQGIKFVIKRPRPEGDWGEIYRKSDPHSFPSGHAARAMMLTLLILLAGPLWLGLLMLAWTCLVAVARIALGVHYFSDILVGITIGSFFAGLVFLLFG
jgi:undecaprenyl-diphosphatase